MNPENRVYLVFPLIGALIIILIILRFVVFKKKVENFATTVDDKISTSIENNVKCCGNIDWYLGKKKYKELCKK